MTQNRYLFGGSRDNHVLATNMIITRSGILKKNENPSAKKYPKQQPGMVRCRFFKLSNNWISIEYLQSTQLYFQTEYTFKFTMIVK